MTLPAVNWLLNAVPVPVTVGLPFVTATVPCKLFNGMMSVNATPLKAQQEFGLVTVKVRVDVPPTATGLREKLFVMVGGLGLGQPLMTTLSRKMEGSVLLDCAPAAMARKYVVAALAGDDVLLEMVPQLLANPLFVQAPAPLCVHARPSVLARTYQLSPFDQLPCRLALEVMLNPP